MKMQQTTKGSLSFCARIFVYICVLTGVLLNDISFAKSEQVQNVKGDKPHLNAKAGNGYIEFPINDQIDETYSKGEDFAFVVAKVYGDPGNYLHIVNWKGNIVWTSKGPDIWPSSEAIDYLKKNGWIKLMKRERWGEPNTLLFQNDQTLELIPRENIPSKDKDDYRGVSDTCLHVFNMYLKAENNTSSVKKGTFIRLLDQPEEQSLPVDCDEGVNIFKTNEIRTRLAQIEISSDAQLYKVSSDKALLIDKNVAVFLNPNLNFYADHPIDYHYISADEAYAAEKKAILSVFKGDEKAFGEEGKYIKDYSAFYDRPAQLPKAEQMLADDLQYLFRNHKYGN